jgi:hypothetical protein
VKGYDGINRKKGIDKIISGSIDVVTIDGGRKIPLSEIKSFVPMPDCTEIYLSSRRGTPQRVVRALHSYCDDKYELDKNGRYGRQLARRSIQRLLDEV